MVLKVIKSCKIKFISFHHILLTYFWLHACANVETIYFVICAVTLQSFPIPITYSVLWKKNHPRVNIRCHSSDMANCYLKLAEISLSQLKFNNRSALFLLLIVTQPPPLPSWTILHPLVRFQLLTSLITHLQGVNFKMHGERCFFLLADERKNKGKWRKSDHGHNGMGQRSDNALINCDNTLRYKDPYLGSIEITKTSIFEEKELHASISPPNICLC